MPSRPQASLLSQQRYAFPGNPYYYPTKLPFPINTLYYIHIHEIINPTAHSEKPHSYSRKYSKPEIHTPYG
jgi:hypothetical protein